MAQPTEYAPSHEFLTNEGSDPNFPGSELDIEFNALKTTTDEIRTNLALIQRDDGALKNRAVGYDQLADELRTGGMVTFAPWATGIYYVENRIVVHGSSLYRALETHTSGTFATDLANEKWVLLGSLPASTVPGPQGDKGWSPVFSIVTDGTRRVLRVVGWQGGEGTEPASGQYVGASGLVAVVGDAVDIRGPQGAAGDMQGPGTAAVGNVPTFANTDGTELADSGVALSDLATEAYADQAAANAVAQFPDKQSLELALITGDEIEYIRIAGYFTAGDGGGGLYKRAASEPSHIGKIRSLDGTWWELAETSPNVLMFGAKADGAFDPVTETATGTDNSAIFQEAQNYLSARGGGTLQYPLVGTGIYISNDIVYGRAYVKHKAETGVKFYARAFRWLGSLGDEVPLAANANRYATQISIADASGVAPGDWCLLTSQAQALHADAGAERLGEPTGSESSIGTYFGEPIEVKSKVDNTLTLTRGLHFTGYRIDNKTISGGNPSVTATPRASATVQKINFLHGAEWDGGEFLSHPSSSIRLDFKLCHYPVLRNAIIHKGTVPGEMVRLERCYRGLVQDVHGDHAVGAAVSSSYNAFCDANSWWSTWRRVGERNGWQSFDVTYVTGLTPPIEPQLVDCYSRSSINGWTFHSGSSGGIVENFFADGCDAGCVNRSRNVSIRGGRYLGSTLDVNNRGITNRGWGVGSTIIGAHVEGYAIGIYLDRGSSVAPAPIFKDVQAALNKITRCTSGIVVGGTIGGSGTVETPAHCGIAIEHNRIVDCIDAGVDVAAYFNGVVVRDNFFGPLTGVSPVAIRCAQNSVDHVITGNVAQDIGGSATFVVLPGAPSDLTTFPSASYPSDRVTQRDNVSYGSNGGGGVIISLGAISSGTIRPDPRRGMLQHYVNNGAHTLAPPAVDGYMEVLITNGAAAGAITTSGFGAVVGGAFSTVNGHTFLCGIEQINGVSTLTIMPRQ